MLERIVITPESTVRFAKALRQRTTRAERLLWRKLRARRFHGIKFRRQTGFGRFIPDFLCVEHMLIIELDGDAHLKKEDYDKRRQAWLESQGFRVIRFSNDQIIEGMDFVLGRVAAACGVPSPSPSPAGRGKDSAVFYQTPYIT